MAGIQNNTVRDTVKVLCTESRSIPRLGVIANKGEYRTVSAQIAEKMVATGCFEVAPVVEVPKKKAKKSIPVHEEE